MNLSLREGCISTELDNFYQCAGWVSDLPLDEIVLYACVQFSIGIRKVVEGKKWRSCPETNGTEVGGLPVGSLIAIISACRTTEK